MISYKQQKPTFRTREGKRSDRVRVGDVGQSQAEVRYRLTRSHYVNRYRVVDQVTVIPSGLGLRRLLHLSAMLEPAMNRGTQAACDETRESCSS